MCSAFSAYSIINSIRKNTTSGNYGVVFNKIEHENNLEKSNKNYEKDFRETKLQAKQ